MPTTEEEWGKMMADMREDQIKNNVLNHAFIPTKAKSTIFCLWEATNGTTREVTFKIRPFSGFGLKPETRCAIRKY